MSLPPVLVRAAAQLLRGRLAVPERRLRVLEAATLGPGQRLAVVGFGGRALLLAVSRGGVTLLAETEA